MKWLEQLDVAAESRLGPAVHSSLCLLFEELYGQKDRPGTRIHGNIEPLCLLFSPGARHLEEPAIWTAAGISSTL